MLISNRSKTERFVAPDSIGGRIDSQRDSASCFCDCDSLLNESSPNTGTLKIFANKEKRNMEAITDFDNANDAGCTVSGDKHLVIRLNSLEEVLELEILIELLVSLAGVSWSDSGVEDLPHQIEDQLFLSRSDL